MLHLKDRLAGAATSQSLNTAAEHFTEVGAGTIDWKLVFAAAEKIGVQHYFVERDSGSVPAMKSLAISYKNLQTLL
jgi:sugar phosphate isomerase/epimerase